MRAILTPIPRPITIVIAILINTCVYIPKYNYTKTIVYIDLYINIQIVLQRRSLLYTLFSVIFYDHTFTSAPNI